MAYFLDRKSDATMFSVFKRSKHHWVSIEGEIKKWVELNWSKWEREKPEWFTDKWKASVPEYMKPTKKTGEVDGGDKTSEENEGEEALMVGGGEEQKGRRRSVLEIISGQTAVSSKVMPAGGMREGIEAEEFLREIKRRGSMNL